MASQSITHPVLSASESDWLLSFCPQAPEWSIPWESLASLPFARAMAQCNQDEQYHAEGDVWTHTQMVCESLVKLAEWRNLPPPHRAIVLLAALLHDVGKPHCSKQDSLGRVSSQDHGKIGARIVRQLLWTDVSEHSCESGASLVSHSVPLFVREVISNMVRQSGLPFWLSDREDPRRAVIRASQVVRCDWLALMSQADARGRECADQQQLLERVALFGEYCREQACFSAPFAFPSAHSRFTYFHKKQSDPLRHVYDDTKSEVIMMSGLPGSGKDTWVSRHVPEGYQLISLDRIRDELGIAADEPQDAVVAEARERARELLRRHQPIVWNATNTTRFMRDKLISMFVEHAARVRLVYVEPESFDELLTRNRQRSRPAPESVLLRLVRNLEPPDLTEAHEVEWVVTR